MIVGAVLGSLAILFTVIAAIVFMWRRHRRKNRQSVVSSFADASSETNSQMRVTPFILTPPRTTWWEHGRRVVFRDSQSRTPDPVQVSGAANVHGSHPAPPPQAQRLSSPSLASVPIGLSAKELARLRARTLSCAPLEVLQGPHPGQTEGVSVVTDIHEPPHASQSLQWRSPSPSILSASTNISAMELGRLCAEALHSQQIPVNNESIEPQFEPVPVSVATADHESEQDTASETRELRSVVESLRRKVERLCAGRIGAPPSYTEGGST